MAVAHVPCSFEDVVKAEFFRPGFSITQQTWTLVRLTVVHNGKYAVILTCMKY
jgi:hypothetical protein